MTEPDSASAQESFISHLVELRDRLVKACAAIVVAFLGLMPFATRIYDFVAEPMLSALPKGSKMIATGVVAPFLIPMKVVLLVAFVIALPVVLYQAWAFVAPGLYEHEKRLVAPLVVSSTLLFVLGIAFCYIFVFKTVFHFIAQFSPSSITVAPDIENYFDFVLNMFFAFGLTFEVPVAVVVLVRVGIVTVQQLKAIRPYVIVGAFVIGAIFAPPDITSQILLAVPICVLYELGLLVAPLFVRLTRAPETQS